MKLYDNLQKTYKNVEDCFIQNNLLMYVCGPTVYDHMHVGNIRPLIVFDTLYRLFLYKNYKVKYVRNITDINEKIDNKALDLHITPNEVADLYEEEFNKMCKKLNLHESVISVRVRDHMTEIIEYIHILLENKKAYINEKGIYFDVLSINYEFFNPKETDNNISRIIHDNSKKNTEDFALWKFRSEKAFYSPWGMGIPGWHIECSVMIYKNLDKTITLHGGGIDLQFPHHTNELAQCLGAFNCNLSHIWIHNNMLNINGEKMSKSLGNALYAKDIITNSHEGDLWRYILLSHHYSGEIFLDDQKIFQAEQAILSFRKFYFYNQLHKYIKQSSYDPLIVSEWEDNFQTNKAIQELHIYIKEKKIEEFFTLSKILGFNFPIRSLITESEILLKINEIKQFKEKKQYNKSDLIREKLYENYVCVEERKEGIIWYYY